MSVHDVFVSFVVIKSNILARCLAVFGIGVIVKFSVEVYVLYA